MKKFITILLCFVLLMTSVACSNSGGGPKGDGDDVIIEVVIQDLGYGKQWLEESNARFVELVKDKDYGNGKKGVFFNYHFQTPEDPSTMSTSGNHVYYGYSGAGAIALSNTGNLLNIDDIVKEKYDERDGAKISIEDKMYDNYKSFSKGSDGEYYTIPTMEAYCGMSYDVDLFDRKGFYLAKPDAEYFLSEYSEVVDRDFDWVDVTAENWESDKSVGPNGIAGDYDDGLPSSLYELVALWEYMADQGVQPVQTYGEYPTYPNVFLQGIMASLMGKDRITTMNDLNGELEVVTGFGITNVEGENLFGNVDYLKRPVTEIVDITEETGFYISMPVEKYYAYALMNIINEEGWWADGSVPDYRPISHLNAQLNFLCSGYRNAKGTAPEIGMIIDGSYWYHESVIRNNVKTFEALNKGVERKVAWMPLPVNIANSVTGEDKTGTVNGITESLKGEPQTLYVEHSNCLYFNKKIEEDESLYAAIKDWIKFAHSDAELSKKTASAGYKTALQYEVTKEDKASWSGFYRDLFEVSRISNVIRPNGNNATYEKNRNGIFKRGETAGLFVCHTGSYIRCLRLEKNKGYHDAREAFEANMITPAQWKNYYAGTNIDGIKYLKNKDGKEIFYTRPANGQFG